MSIVFHQASVVEHQDEIGMTNAVQAMGDDQHGAVFHQFAQGALDCPFGVGIDTGGGLVEQHDGGILEQGAGDGQALAFAAGQVAAVLVEAGVVALWQAFDEVVGLGQSSGLFDLFAVGVLATDARTLQVAHELDTLLLSSRPHPLLCEAKCLELLGCFMLADEAIPLPAHGERERLQHARELLLANIAEPPTIADLAHACGLNTLKLKRGFKALFGPSISGSACASPMTC